MQRETAIRGLMVALLWLAIAGALAAGYRYLLSPEVKDSIQGVPEPTEVQWDRLAQSGPVSAQPIAFSRGSPELSEAARAELQALSVKLKAAPRLFVRVFGQARPADDDAAREANRALAQQRADNVAIFLTEQGLGKQRIRTAIAEPGDADLAQSVTFVIGPAP